MRGSCASVPRLTFGPRGGLTMGFQCLFKCSHERTQILSKPSRSFRATVGTLLNISMRASTAYSHLGMSEL